MNAASQPPQPRRRRRRGALAAALLALPVLGVILSDLLPHGEAYQAGGLPLLAALGGLALTGCAGHVLEGRVLFDGGALLRACAVFSRGLHLAAPAPDGESAASGEPPPPVLPYFSSYFTLYAGLSGWVDELSHSREAMKASPGDLAPR